MDTYSVIDASVLVGGIAVVVAEPYVKERLKPRDVRSVERHQRKMKALERVIETPGLGLR